MRLCRVTFYNSEPRFANDIGRGALPGIKKELGLEREGMGVV